MKKILFSLLFIPFSAMLYAQPTHVYDYNSFNGSFNCHGEFCGSNTNPSDGSIGDLSCTSHYRPYVNGLWDYHIIMPTGAAKIKLNIFNVDLGLNGNTDRIYVYDGYDPDSPLLAEYSGNNLPQDTIYSTGTVLCIVFETDDLSNGEIGWSAEYFGVTPVPTVYTAASGTIVNVDYRDYYGSSPCVNYQLKEFLIKPEGASKVELSFPLWEIDPDSPMEIYDGDSETANLIGAYGYDTPPPTITSTGNSLLIKYVVDWDCARFTAQYTGIAQSESVTYGYDASGNRTSRNLIVLKSAKVEGGSKVYGQAGSQGFGDTKPHQEKIGNQGITIYPNPTSGHLRVDIAGFDATRPSVIYVYDPAGKLAIEKSPATGSDDVDLSRYPNGLYLMRIVLDGKVSDWKIIKE